MKYLNSAISPRKDAPTEAMTRVIPRFSADFKRCEIHLNVGIFFDGTNNNKEKDRKNRSHTNIARMHNLYNSDVKTGYYNIYIPGVGTVFKDIGEDTESKLGAGCAFGCEARVIFGLLEIFNALHNRSYEVNMFDKQAVLALCRNGINVIHTQDREKLAKFGVTNGLLQPHTGNNFNRIEFLKKQASYLETKLKIKKPRVVECFIDIFGFSRGAAEARVFCHWLDELLIDGCLAGVPLRFRFVGIFDTVASAGFWSGASAIASNSTGGHGAWASAESLRVPASVQNCVHMIAMHELRRNFPLDEIGDAGKLQKGWVQHAYPGAHSDVGGGYQPGDLGISVGDDSLKLSQIPLNHMLDCAIASGVPLTRTQADPDSYDPIAIHSDLAKAYDDFISQVTLAPRPMYEWLQQYLNWRWQVRNQFHITNQVKKAKKQDKDILIKFNASLINDADAMIRSATMSFTQRTFAVFKDTLYRGARKDFMRTSVLDPEAREVLARAQHAKPTPPSFVALFDGYVHDSLAGFDSSEAELTGYWRYRKIFLGSDESAIAENQYADSTSKLA